jgi:hypothetical protein
MNANITTIDPSLSSMTIEDLISNINYVIQNVDNIYKDTHTRSEYIFYKLGQKTSSVFSFFRSPQAKVISLLVFWAFFVTSWVMTAFAISTLSAFVLFGVLIAIYTNLTATAVSSIIKDTMFNFYSGLVPNVA